MRALLERAIPVRVAGVLFAAACVSGLVQAAEAGRDAGLRRRTVLPDESLAAFGSGPHAPAAREPVERATSAPKRHRPRRIWAAARGRPLRIALERPRSRAVARTGHGRGAAAPVRRASGAPVFRLVPPPGRPALVSIYNDRTLRSGDAVMLGDGVHVFRDDGFWPHRPRDFVKLQEVAGLDWHLRRTLEPFDINPPTRWTSIMVPPA